MQATRLFQKSMIGKSPVYAAYHIVRNLDAVHFEICVHVRQCLFMNNILGLQYLLRFVKAIFMIEFRLSDSRQLRHRSSKFSLWNSKQGLITHEFLLLKHSKGVCGFAKLQRIKDRNCPCKSNYISCSSSVVWCLTTVWRLHAMLWRTSVWLGHNVKAFLK